MESEAGSARHHRPSSGAKAGSSPATGPETDPASPGPPPRGLRAFPPPLAGRGGARREHKRLQLPSGRRPTSPTPGPGPARGEESSRKRQGGRERARMGRAGDPGPRVRAGIGWGKGSQELVGLPGLQEWPKKEFLKIGSGQREELGDRKETRNTLKKKPAATTHPRGEVWRKPRSTEEGGAAALGDGREGEGKEAGPAAA